MGLRVSEWVSMSKGGEMKVGRKRGGGKEHGTTLKMFRFPAIACQIEHEERPDSAELVSESSCMHFLDSFNSLGLICGGKSFRPVTSSSFFKMRAVHPSFLPHPVSDSDRAMCRVPSRYFKCFGGETGAAAAAAVMRCMSCPGAIAPPPFVPRESPIRERP